MKSKTVASIKRLLKKAHVALEAAEQAFATLQAASVEPKAKPARKPKP